ncbi:unnamed protein product [Choristocarpus tenellus]
MQMVDERSDISRLKNAVVGVVAAALVVGTIPAGVHAEISPAPPLLQTATGSVPPATPTAKLEGELLGQYQKAQTAGSVAQFDKALKLYNQVIKYSPGYVYGWSNRGNVLIAQGDLEGAISDYSKALELGQEINIPDAWVIYLNRSDGS